MGRPCAAHLPFYSDQAGLFASIYHLPSRKVHRCHAPFVAGEITRGRTARMRFFFFGSRFALNAAFPHSVALMQLRFASFAVINLRRDLHPRVCANAGRT